MSVPGIFAPVVLDGVPLGDGGIADYLPIGPARRAGATRIVAVDAIEPPREAWPGPLANAMRAFRHSAHGRALLAAGFEGDLRYASQVDVFDTVPVLYDEDGVKTMRTKPREKKARQA